MVRPEYTPAQQNGHADTADGGSCFDRICPNLGATDVESSDVESSLITTGCFLLNTEVPFRLGCFIFAAFGSVSVAIQCFISLAVLVRTEFEMCDVFCRGGSDYVW